MDIKKLDFTQNQGNKNNINDFVKRIYKGNLANLAIIEIDNFNGIGVIYGLRAISEILEIFYSKALDFFPQDYEFYILGFGVFGLLTNDDVSLEDFLQKLKAFNDLFIKYEFSIKRAKISLSLYNGVSSKGDIKGSSKYRFDILKEAFCALMDTKSSYKRLIVFDKTKTHLNNIAQKIRTTKLIYQAFVSDTLLPYFQPIVDLKTNKIFKYEALARIQTINNEVFYPKDFFQVLKKNILYTRAIKCLISKALDIAIQRKVDISINLNIADIEDREMSDWLLKEIQRLDLGSHITIEITEHERTKDFSILSDFFNRLKVAGIQVAIDDFGCGYSNLEILMHIQIDFIKVDGSFITNIDKDDHKAKIVAGIVKFAKALGIATIAEFVSTKEIYEKVKELGIDYVQGYFTGKPINLG